MSWLKKGLKKVRKAVGLPAFTLGNAAKGAAIGGAALMLPGVGGALAAGAGKLGALGGAAAGKLGALGGALKSGAIGAGLKKVGGFAMRNPDALLAGANVLQGGLAGREDARARGRADEAIHNPPDLTNKLYGRGTGHYQRVTSLGAY